MKKNMLLLAVLVFAFTVIIGITAGAFSQIEPNIGNETIKDDVLLANEKLYNSFARDENGSWVFPDEFGGVYAKPDRLIVFLTDCSLAKRQKYLNITENYQDALVFQSVKHSYNNLLAGANEIGTLLLTEKYHVSSWYVDVLKNKAVVAVAPDSYEQALLYLKNSKNLPQWLILEMEEVAHVEDTVIGGDYIVCDQNNVGMTLGAGGYVGTNSCIITCGHGTNSTYNTLSKVSSSSSFGYVTARSYPAANGSSVGDYSVVRMYSGNYISPEVWKYNDYSTIKGVTGGYGIPAAGTTVTRYGVSTGIKTASVAANTMTVVYYDNNSNYYQVTNMLRALVLEGQCSAPGDSGAPYFVTIAGDLYLCGVHSGSNGVDYVYFTPYGIINYMASFTVAIQGE